jgi:hypothetical protein
VDRLAAVYGGDWWYASLLAFVRQEQGQWADATTLADRALAAEPASGHAVHARAHVHYETGEHAAGLAWLTEWVAGTGRDVRHRSHFGWHAALHELALGDDSAVRRRYDTQVAPPHSAGLRALIDAGSLLWRGALADVWRRPLPTAPLLAAAGNAALTRPGSPFTALHAALLLAADGDLSRLAALRQRVPDAQTPMVDGLLAFAEERYDDAATLLGTVDLGLGGLGGSAAQREVVEDTALRALVLAGRLAEARAVLARRLDRRPSPRDVSCLAALGPPAAG